MNRDEKGRFTKGNKEGRKFSKRDGRATECAKKSNESQVGVKKFKEYLADNLSTEIKRPDGTTTTIKDYITFRLIEKAKQGDTRAIEMMLKLIDEYPTDKHDVMLNAPQGVTITCETKQQEEILKRLQNKCKD
jgi:hypothetical protein